MIDQIGYLVDELCNRNSCAGILESNAEYGISCSCHINPPCHKCTAGVNCPECGYNSEDEAAKSVNNYKSSFDKNNEKNYWNRGEQIWEYMLKTTNETEIVEQIIQHQRTFVEYRLRVPNNINIYQLYKHMGCNDGVSMPSLHIISHHEKYYFARLSYFTD